MKRARARAARDPSRDARRTSSPSPRERRSRGARRRRGNRAGGRERDLYPPRGRRPRDAPSPPRPSALSRRARIFQPPRARRAAGGVGGEALGGLARGLGRVRQHAREEVAAVGREATLRSRRAAARRCVRRRGRRGGRGVVGARRRRVRAGVAEATRRGRALGARVRLSAEEDVAHRARFLPPPRDVALVLGRARARALHGGRGERGHELEGRVRAVSVEILGEDVLEGREPWRARLRRRHRRRRETGGGIVPRVRRVAEGRRRRGVAAPGLHHAGRGDASVCAPRRTQRALFLPSGARTIHDDFSESATLAAVSLTGRRLVCCAAALMTAVRCRRRPRAARFFSRSSSSQIAAPIAPTPRPRPNRMARLAAPLRTGLLFLALLAGSAGASLARAALPPAPRAAPSRSPAADRRFRDRAKTPRPRAFPPSPREVVSRIPA